MDQHNETEEVSDDTPMISELLKSAQVIQATQLATVSMTEKNEQQIKDQRDQLLNVMEKKIVISGAAATTSSIIAMDHNANNIAAPEYADMLEDSNKLNELRHVNIPYILNGELYQIQTQDGENVTVKCCHCPPDRVYRGSVRSTGNFHMHIKRRHPDLLEKLHNMKVNALLERRDRLLRNRKFTSRQNHRIRMTGLSPYIAPEVATSKQETFNDKAKLSLANFLARPMPLTSSPTELDLLQTHKLKIKEVFERHQEAAEMRNWNNSQEGCSEEPIDYSLKSHEIPIEHECQQQHQPQQQQNISDTIITHANVNCDANPSDHQPTMAVNESRSNGNLCESQQYNIRDFFTTISSQSSTSSPSVMSTFSLRHTINSMQYNNNNLEEESMINSQNNHHKQAENGLSVIKPEHLMVASVDQQAMDLSIRNDSGIYSSSSINDTSQNSNIEPNTNLQRAGSQNDLFTTQIVEQSVGSKEAAAVAAATWQDLLQHVKCSLRDIQNEMNVRNQIETNRLFLDMAKFKFLNPGFQFNW